MNVKENSQNLRNPSSAIKGSKHIAKTNRISLISLETKDKFVFGPEKAFDFYNILKMDLLKIP